MNETDFFTSFLIPYCFPYSYSTPQGSPPHRALNIMYCLITAHIWEAQTAFWNWCHFLKLSPTLCSWEKTTAHLHCMVPQYQSQTSRAGWWQQHIPSMNQWSPGKVQGNKGSESQTVKAKSFSYSPKKKKQTTTQTTTKSPGWSLNRAPELTAGAQVGLLTPQLEMWDQGSKVRLLKAINGCCLGLRN